MPEMPLWLTADLVVKMMQTVSIICVGVLGTRIAWRQADTARNKLKLDLYERRYQIYQLLLSLLYLELGKNRSDPEIEQQLSQLSQAQFLFEDDVNKWLVDTIVLLRELHHLKWIIQQDHNEYREHKPDSKEGLDVIRQAEILGRLNLRSMGLTDLFLPYLNFRGNL